MRSLQITLSCDETGDDERFFTKSSNIREELEKYLNFVDHQYKEEYLMVYDKGKYDKEEQYYYFYNEKKDLNFYMAIEN